ncbi:VOC family protein [Streptomyces sp. NPDC085929]|uniref:VOC family protein n=1 Tax=Streptomyces sp. NPDC085929 TaxID=3365739 RepID=UPI0037D7B9BB
MTITSVVVRRRVADLDAVVARGEAAGAEVVAAPADTPNGRRAALRHPDGAVYEYVSG